MEAVLNGANNDTWPAIRNLLQRESELAVAGLSGGISGYDMYEQSKEKMIADLKNYARGLVEAKTREGASRILILMKDRFSTLFSLDADSMPRVWNGKEDIRAITKTARSASLKLLSAMAATRLDADNMDNIEATLSASLLSVPNKSSVNAKSLTTLEPLASSTWEQVPSSKTLITPVECRSLWRQFKTETEYSVSQAIAAQEANKRSNGWLPPTWVIGALILLGFNEFMILLRNPLYLVVLFVGYLIIRSLWAQLKSSAHFRNGALPGLLSLAANGLPSLKDLSRRAETHA